MTGTSPNSVTLTLYPFGKETSIGIGKVLILIREFLLKVMWFDAPESRSIDWHLIQNICMIGCQKQ